MLLPDVAPYNLLMVVPVESKSIHHFYTKLAEHLVSANHSVTLLTSHNSSFSHPNFRHVNVIGNDIPHKVDFFAMTEVTKCFKKLRADISLVARKMWTNENVVKVWKKRGTFDGFLLASHLNNVGLPFLLNFTGVFILISNPGLEYVASTFMGNWLPLSVVPTFLLPFDENMNFLERCVNVVSLFLLYHYNLYALVTSEEQLLRSFFPEFRDLMSYYERASLTLINGDYALDNPVPLLPNQVEIGTLNAHPPGPLPKDLEDFMESSGDHGVIYFSLGSIAKSTDIPARAKVSTNIPTRAKVSTNIPARAKVSTNIPTRAKVSTNIPTRAKVSTDIPARAKREFIEAFRRLPQKIIWKYEGDDIVLPPNVLTSKWLLQQDILGHPKTRVFISHCGIMGTQELKYHGVPVLAVPIAFDQHRNAARMIRKKLGLLLSWDTLTADDIVESMDILVNDTSYAERLRKLSAVLQDQKETPAERAVWWIEYVIRHQGAPHLQYPGKKLHFLQYICADVMFFLTVCLYIVYRLMKMIVMRLLQICFKKQMQPKLKRN
ncbi:UDP-glucuronosyl/UDP-glucosyltransferase [Trinorchestia longiramus]|nr:UDP-glucuronosyl/UDP-glucosyltransferase [Trinorchestia longiramus]